MSNEQKPVGYAAMVTEAEVAVASVKDPELRRVAFEKILTTLLEQVTTPHGPSRAKPGGRKAGKYGARAGAQGEKNLRRGPKAYVQELIKDSFFKKQRTLADVKAELVNRGHHVALTSLSGPLQLLTQEKQLRRQKTSADGKGTKTTFVYSNW
jgi:hypothetical protein